MHLRPIVAAALGLAALVPLAPPVHAQGNLERLFYYVDAETSWESLVRNIAQIDVVAPQAYIVDSLGIVFGDVDARLIALARQHQVRVMPLVVNEGFNQPGLKRLLGDSAARARSIAAMVELCRRHGFWGIQFDIENVSLEDRDRLTAWYTEAATALHAGGFRISIAVVHRPDELPGTNGYHRFLFESWRAAYDLAALARVGDFISIMSYNQHTRRTPPGPQASLPWTRDVVDHFLKHVPAEKLSLGIATQGYRFFTRYDPSLPERARSWAETVSWTWGTGLAERHGATLQWDPAQGVTWGWYASGGTNEWLFLEDVRSFQAKRDLAVEKRLRGYSVWVLGPEDQRIWELLRAERRTRPR